MTRPARTRGPVPGTRFARALERSAIVGAAMALSIALIVLLAGFFAHRDQPGVSSADSEPGQAFADLGHGALRPGEARPRYNSDPPTSGAHRPAGMLRDGAPFTNDQLLQALQAGDVVIVYGSRRPPAGLESFVHSMAPAFTPALAAAGEAVILAPRPRTAGIVALAWAHLLRVRRPSDPALRDFVGFWLGRGAPGAG